MKITNYAQNDTNMLTDVNDFDIVNGTFEIPKGVITIGSGALSNCESLEEREVIRLVTVGNGNSDLELKQYYTDSILVNKVNIFNNQIFTSANFKSVDYNNTKEFFNSQKTVYSDAGEQQYIIAGSKEEFL